MPPTYALINDAVIIEESHVKEDLVAMRDKKDIPEIYECCVAEKKVGYWLKQ